MSELSKKAAQIIRERGWFQGNFETHDGRLCIVGALRVAAWGHADLRPLLIKYKVHDPDASGDDVQAYHDKEQLVNDEVWALTGKLGSHTTDIYMWNDNPARDVREVLALLESDDV